MAFLTSLLGTSHSQSVNIPIDKNNFFSMHDIISHRQSVTYQLMELPCLSKTTNPSNYFSSLVSSIIRVSWNKGPCAYPNSCTYHISSMCKYAYLYRVYIKECMQGVHPTTFYYTINASCG